ncbi:MAG: phytanoyl-CoA dioxygenase family protein [Ignavibacteria bacterium]
MDFWNRNWYVIIKNAVSKDDCKAAENAIWNFIDATPDNRDSWYKNHPAKQGIMIQFLRNPALDKNRNSPKIRIAFEQLWNRKDLIVTTDRVSFNTPERSGYQFSGPYMHWDTSIHLPIPLGLQGILYLVDVQENQGAFTCVPGFHNKIENWLKNLPAGTDPRGINFDSLGAKPIAANAGDFIIWHHALPHGSRPNTGDYPRIVQYIKWYPPDYADRRPWK